MVIMIEAGGDIGTAGRHVWLGDAAALSDQPLELVEILD